MLYCSLVFCQKTYLLNIIVNNEQKSILNKYSFKKEFKDTLSRKQEVKNLLHTLWNDGYITASVDSIVKKDSNKISSYLNIGKKYLWVKLKKGNVGDALLQEAGYKEKIFNGKHVDYRDVSMLNEKIIKYCENNGYPFASVKLDTFSFTDSSITASLNISKNKMIVIDSVVLRGKVKLSKTYLYNYLGIKPGDLYNESRVADISKRIKELQFMKEIRPFNIIFNNNKATIVIFAEKKKSSQADGIIGIAPNAQTAGTPQTSGKLMVTGQLTLNLINSFFKGEMIDLDWQKLQPRTQQLNTSFVYPYLFKTPFGFDFKFNLYKADTFYLNLETNIGIRYNFTGNNYIKPFYENRSTSLISTSQYKYVTTLPQYLDMNSNMYGIEYKLQHLDYLYNPRRGYDMLVSGSVGTNQIKKNSAINDTLYNTIKLNSTQYKFTALLNFYIPLFTKSAIKLGLNAASLQGKDMFENDFFRIGGLNTLRGFDEASIYTSTYVIGTVEYHYIFEQNSYLFAFWNGAYYESKTVTKFVHDTPYGFGVGVSFETKAGIFSLSYALGKQFNNPIIFKQAKISFGIVNYF
jgi:Surface antigen variable number repeat